MAKHFGEAQWRTWFCEFEQNDLTVGKFCETIGVSVQSYYKWRRRLNIGVVELESTAEPAIPHFVPLVLANSIFEIELPCGAKARVANDLESLRPVMQVLIELGAKR